MDADFQPPGVDQLGDGVVERQATPPIRRLVQQITVERGDKFRPLEVAFGPSYADFQLLDLGGLLSQLRHVSRQHVLPRRHQLGLTAFGNTGVVQTLFRNGAPLLQFLDSCQIALGQVQLRFVFNQTVAFRLAPGLDFVAPGPRLGQLGRPLVQRGAIIEGIDFQQKFARFHSAAFSEVLADLEHRPDHQSPQFRFAARHDLPKQFHLRLQVGHLDDFRRDRPDLFGRRFRNYLGTRRPERKCAQHRQRQDAERQDYFHGASHYFRPRARRWCPASANSKAAEPI